MENIETKEEQNIDMIINGLGVFELRGVARQLGVASPTTKKRDELIALIKEQISNGAFFKEAMTQRGRPYKKLNILDTIAEKINNEVAKMDFSNNKSISFAQDTYSPLDLRDFEGIVNKYSATIEIRDISTGTLVKIDKTEELDELLERGDKVKAVVEKQGKNFVLKKILAINDIDIKDYKSQFVAKGCPVLVNDEIPFDDTKAVVGRRNLYKLSYELFETQYLENLISFCQKEDYSLIAIAINTSFENEIMFKALPIKEKFITTYGASHSFNYHKVLDALNHAENLLDRGKKVIVFVADIVEVVRSLDRYFNIKKDDNTEDLDEATVAVAQKLIKFARAYKTGCSGTSILCYNDVDKDDVFLTTELLKISKRIN